MRSFGMMGFLKSRYCLKHWDGRRELVLEKGFSKKPCWFHACWNLKPVRWLLWGQITHFYISSCIIVKGTYDHTKWSFDWYWLILIELNSLLSFFVYDISILSLPLLRHYLFPEYCYEDFKKNNKYGDLNIIQKIPKFRIYPPKLLLCR